MLLVTFRALLHRKLRLLLSATAVVLGVSFVAGALTLTSSLGRVFDKLFAGVDARTAVQVRGTEPFQISGQNGQPTRRPVPASLLPTLRAVPGVTAVVGDVSGYAQLLTKDGKPYGSGNVHALGRSYDTNAMISPFTLHAGQPPSHATQVALDAATAKATGFHVGSTVTLLLRDGRRSFTVSAVFGFGSNDTIAGTSIAAFDHTTAQTLLGKPGQYDVVRLGAAPGISQSELRDRVRAVLPAGTEAVTGSKAADESAGDIKKTLNFFSTFLLVFAGVALFVGAFLIFNTFTILIAQRQRELALLRALGATRGQVIRSVLVEAGVVGVIASGVGLGLGVLVAIGLQSLLRALGGSLPAGPLIVTAGTVIASFAVGVLVTGLSALLPACKASTVPPVAAMRDAMAVERSLRRGILVGVVLLLLGTCAITLGLHGSLAVLGLGALICFLAVAALSPLLSRPAARVLGLPMARGIAGRLGRGNAMRNPRRTASTAAALMVGLALVSTVSILGASARASIDKIVKGAVGADLVVQPKQNGQGLPAAVRQTLASGREVGRTDVLRFESARVRGQVSFVMAVPARSLGRSVLLVKKKGDLDLAPGVVLTSEREAKAHGLKTGENVPVTFSDGVTRSFRVGGIYADNQLIGPYLFDSSAAADFRSTLDSVLLVTRAPGTSLAALREATGRVLAPYPTVETKTASEFAAETAGRIDVVITIITVLLLLSILIAVLGIVNTLALAVLERTRELGLLRAVGLARSQTRRMVTVEAVIVSVFGALLGIAVGSAFGVTLQRELVGVGVTELRFPFARMVTYVAVAALAGVVAAVLPARRAAHLDVLAAVAST